MGLRHCSKCGGMLSAQAPACPNCGVVPEALHPGVPLVRMRLSVQMFLQFAIWGSWAPVLAQHLVNIGLGDHIGAVYGAGTLASMISPLIAGQIADRWFATERFLSFMFACSGAIFLYASTVTDFETLWWLTFLGMFFFAPTLGLGNSLSFTHLSDPRRQFPAVRVWGTIGWIAAGYALSGWLKISGRTLGDCLLFAGGFALLNALYCVTLPHTPPRREAREPFAVLKALRMLRDPSFALFTLLAFFLLMFAAFYYNYAGAFFPAVGVKDDNLPIVMAIGQIAEILTMFALPFVYTKLGPKWTIAVGLLAWAARFGIFALGTPWELVIASQALHGVCFAFAIAAAMIYVERVCEADIRASAQSLLSFVTYGLGLFAGSYAGNWTLRYFTDARAENVWRSFWTVPAIGCLAVLIIFIAGFRPRERSAA